MEAEDQKLHCYWFYRTIPDIETRINKVPGKEIETNKELPPWKFVDLNENVKDTEAERILEYLKSQKLPKKLPQENITSYQVPASQACIEMDVKDLRANIPYINTFCVDFETVLKRMIDNGIEER